MAALALILAVAACDKGDKKDDKGAEVSAAVAGSGSASASASGSGSAAASGAGSASGTGSGSASAAVDPKLAEAPAGTTGDATCDQLVALTRCVIDKMGNVSAEERAESETEIATWKAGIANEATRQRTIDLCKRNIDIGRTGFEQLGCGVDLGGATAGVGFGSGAGSGGGGTAVAAAGSTGAAECDELVARTRCSMDKVGEHMPKDAIKAFEDGVKSWQDALSMDGAVRTATIDACKMALDSGKAGFEMSGCGGPEHGPLLGASGGGSGGSGGTAVTAGGALPTVESVGEPTCDKLIERTMCMYQKAGSGVPPEAIQAFADGVKQWKEMLQNASMKKAIIDACEQSLKGAEAGFKSMGC